MTEIVSDVLDGSVVQGRAAGNRSPQFQVTIWEIDPVARADIENALFKCLNADTWELLWTPSGGITVALTCMRATLSLLSTPPQEELEGIRTYQITCGALPYVRSLESQTIDIVVEAPVVIEDFEDTLPDTTYYTTDEPTALQPDILTTQHNISVVYHGTNSFRIQIGSIRRGYPDGFIISKVGLSITTPASGVRSVTLHSQSPWSINDLPRLPITTQWKLVLTVDGVEYTAYATDQSRPQRWETVTFSFPDGIPAGTIEAWSVTSPLFRFEANIILNHTDHFIDYITASSATSVGVNNGFGFVTDVNPIIGSARTPVSLEITRLDAALFRAWCVHVISSDTPNVEPLAALGVGGGSYATQADYDGVYEIWVAYNNPDSTNHGVNIHIDQGGQEIVFPTTRCEAGRGFAKAGIVALPLLNYPDEATTTTTFAATPDYSDLVIDVLILDISSPTVMVDRDNDGFSTPEQYMAWVDKPGALTNLPDVWSGDERETALSVVKYAKAIDAIVLEPGTARMLFYCPGGLLVATMTYTPQWYQEAGSL